MQCAVCVLARTRTERSSFAAFAQRTAYDHGTAPQEETLASACPEVDLGALALRFLQRFGSSFNYRKFGVSIRLGGVVPAARAGRSTKPAKQANGRSRPPGIVLEDPQVRTAAGGSAVVI